VATDAADLTGTGPVSVLGSEGGDGEVHRLKDMTHLVCLSLPVCLIVLYDAGIHPQIPNTKLLGQTD
jgi:hypothetical protein